MRKSIISVKNLSKCYKIGVKIERDDGLRHMLERLVRSPSNWIPFIKNKEKNEDFWAVRDVNIEIERGEIVGIIGHNGAGKSTLLKLLSRITEPTNGSIHLRGRVASLLEVGTGFHSELTGRENIFLNGAVLGMRRLEIKKKFDEIIEFADIQKFLDIPVKKYSSGMYARLAFAVAAHLEPEILIVDEVLSVGDADFQKKCLEKIEDVSVNKERTVIIVSHQMEVIQNICSRCILMDKGQLIFEGKTEEVVNVYLAKGKKLANSELFKRQDREGQGVVRFTSVDLCDESGKIINEAISGKNVIISLKYTVSNGYLLKDCVFCVEICKGLKEYFSLSTELVNCKKLQICGDGQVDFFVPNWPLSAGMYYTNIYVEGSNIVQDYLNNASLINVINGDFFKIGKIMHNSREGAAVLVSHSWIKINNY